MVYNLTNVTNTTEISDFMLELNAASNYWIFTTVLVCIFLIVVIVVKQLNYDFGTALFSASMCSIFMGILLLLVGAISWATLGWFIGIGIGSLFYFMLGGK